MRSARTRDYTAPMEGSKVKWCMVKGRPSGMLRRTGVPMTWAGATRASVGVRWQIRFGFVALGLAKRLVEAGAVLGGTSILTS